MTRAAIAIALVIAACHTPKAPPPAPDQERPACDATSALSAAMALRADGYLQRALDVIVAAEARCTSPVTLLARAEVLADLGMSKAAIEAYRIYAHIDETARRVAATAIAELNERPPETRDTTDDERTLALGLYRDGVSLRLQGDHDQAIGQLRRSYALMPHPLTIVQIGLAHAAAGREVEARRSYARAMAIAELIAGEPPVAQLRTGHMDLVRALELDPDGRRIASASEDGTVKLWDAISGREQRSLLGHEHSVMCVRFSPDGSSIASGSRDETARIWDTATGKLLRTFELGATVRDIAFHPDGSRVVAAAGSAITVWDVATSSLQQTIETGVGTINAIAIDATGNLAAVGGDEHAIELWSLEDGRPIRELLGHEKAINALAFRPGGAELLSASDDHTIRRWQIADGVELSRVTVRITPLEIAFDGEGARYAHVGAATKTEVRDADSNELLGTVDGTFALAFSASHPRLVTLTSTGMTMWDTETFEPVSRFERLPAVRAVVFSGDGTRLAAGGYDRRITVWSTEQDEPLSIDADIGAVANLAFQGAGHELIVATGNAILGVYRLGASVRTSKHVVADNEVAALAVSDAYIAISDGNLVKTWELGDESLRPKAPLDGHTAAVRALAFDNTGVGLASAAHDGSVVLWDVSLEQSFHQTRGHAGMPVNDIDIAAQLPLLVSAGDDGTVTVWDIEQYTGTTLEGHEGPVTAAAFTKNDTYIVSAGADRTLRLWNYQDRVDVQALQAHRGLITDLDVRLSDDLVATASLDGTIRLWDVRRGALLATLATTRDGRWVATAPDGRVAGSEGDAGAMELLYWQAGDIQLPGFVGWQRWHTPDLVRKILAGEGEGERG